VIGSCFSGKTIEVSDEWNKHGIQGGFFLLCATVCAAFCVSVTIERSSGMFRLMGHVPEKRKDSLITPNVVAVCIAVSETSISLDLHVEIVGFNPCSLSVFCIHASCVIIPS
jgi:hypothetical protein